MAKVVVKNNHLHFNGTNYFRRMSEDVVLGSYGKKKMPLNQINYLEVKNELPKSKFKIKEIAKVDIDFSRSGNFEQFANATVLGIFKGSSEKKYEALQSGQLVLTKFIVAQNEIIKAINDSPVHRDNLIEYDNKARVVNEIFVVVEAELARRIEASGSLDGQVSVKAVTAGVRTRGGVSNRSSVKLSTGMCLAYQLLDLKWDAKRKNKKTKVVDTNIDEHGIN